MHVQIISEVRFLRESLAEALQRRGGLTVLGSFSDLQEALAQATVCRPDIILLEESFPDGVEAVRKIRAVSSGILTVVIAATETPENIIAWGEAGVAGYIPRTCGITEVAPLLADIRRGQLACSATVAAGLLRRLAVLCAPTDEGVEMRGVPALTAREVQIGRMIMAGLTNKEIAIRLDIGVATTKTHVHHLLAKLSVQSRGQAAHWMRKHAGRFPDS